MDITKDVTAPSRTAQVLLPGTHKVGAACQHVACPTESSPGLCLHYVPQVSDTQQKVSLTQTFKGH